jgi:hypothetical protein
MIVKVSSARGSALTLIVGFALIVSPENGCAAPPDVHPALAIGLPSSCGTT